MSRVLPYNAKQWEVPLLMDERRKVARWAIRGRITINGAMEHKITFLPYKPRKGGVKSIKYFTMDSFVEHEAPYQPGDILYVREAWGDYRECTEGGCGYYMYRADYPDGITTYMHSDGIICDLPKWHPSIHMPKEAARIWLKVTDVRVERLQEITGEGILAEGIDNGKSNPAMGKRWENMQRIAFENLWDSTIKKSDLDRYGWDANPWVWVTKFERCGKPESEE